MAAFACRARRAQSPRTTPKNPSLQLAAASPAGAGEGWTFLNPQEKALIELLRYTTYHGRNLVMEVALAMRQAHPWVHFSPDSTKTMHPAGPHFWTKLDVEDGQ